MKFSEVPSNVPAENVTYDRLYRLLDAIEATPGQRALIQRIANVSGLNHALATVTEWRRSRPGE